LLALGGLRTLFYCEDLTSESTVVQAGEENKNNKYGVKRGVVVEQLPAAGHRVSLRGRVTSAWN
jgi:hypothetical protein